MTTAPLAPGITLNTGATMPAIGLGLFKVPDAGIHELVEIALQVGYRSFDTAPMYGNEQALGEALRSSGLDRSEVFVTTKVPLESLGYRAALESVAESERLLDLGYLDMCLIHWPGSDRERYLKTWAALESVHSAQRVRSIGLSNFQRRNTDDVLHECSIVPAVNQIEAHPLLTQPGLRGYHSSQGICTQAWAPLARGRLQHDPVLGDIATARNISVAQVILRWHMQSGFAPLPKTSSVLRLRENLDVFGFELTADEMESIAELETGERTGPHPYEVH